MAKVPCRLAALDLDGTLLTDDHVVTDRSCEALQELSARGVVVVLISGRMHRAIQPISDQIGLENPIISYNGGMVKHPRTGEVIHHTPIPAAEAMVLVGYGDREGLHLNFCLNDQLFIKEYNQWSELYEKRTGVPATALGDLRELDGEEPTKMQILDTPEKIDLLLTKCKAEFGERLYVTRTQVEYIEFMNPEVSKGRALQALANQLEISNDLIVTFGDGYNDETMMKIAGFSVAMGNSVDEIKDIADYTTETNQNDGVALAVEHLLL